MLRPVCCCAAVAIALLPSSLPRFRLEAIDSAGLFYTRPVTAAAIAQASTTAAASGRSTRDTTTGLGVEVAVVAVYAVIGGAVVDGCATACIVVHLAL